MYQNRGQKRRRRRKRKNRARSVLAGMIMTGFLLMTAGKAIGSSLTILSTEPSEDNPLILNSQEMQEPSENVSQTEDWKWKLVNPWNPLPEDYQVKLKQLNNGHAIDERCYPELQAMMDDCRAAGLSPILCSSYRSQKKQENLFQDKVNSLVNQGYTKEDARIEAGKSVAVPGTSEHQLGLAVDIVDSSNQNLDKSQENTEVQKWLMEHSWRYGFILRYPNGKSDITGIIYEPWHYRYVGKEAAREIYTQNLCLEEYLDQL